ncbi:MAG TPA: hypothetical protein PKY56_08475 [Candidatus Kapabacteria bacterium]|nr:hypothetical protein [Candidatus Kapabacteria bacterium]HPO63358.1 hypothetical protein [Candidatus Kapabacteria bacterium]
MKKINIYIFLILILPVLLNLTSCVQTPNPSDDNDLKSSKKAAYILCEGLWNMDNSSLARYDFETSSVTNNFFTKVNTNLRIGDLANHLAIKSDTGFIAVTTAKSIEAFNLETGISVGRIIIEGNSAPRKICIINDTLAAFTELYEHKIRFFNPKTIKLLDIEIEVGPAPEGIATDGNYLFVANSGYGDYLAQRPKAGTVSVIDLKTMSEIYTINSGKNTVDVVYNKSINKIFAIYNHLPSLKDSIGGIVMINPSNFQIEKEWKTSARSLCFSDDGQTAYFIDKQGVSKINTNTSSNEIINIIQNPNLNEIWYSLSYYGKDNTLWVGNARNYQINGEVIIYNLNDSTIIKKRFEVGINPNTIVFY